MKTVYTTTLLTAAALGVAAIAWGQQEKRVSPHETVSGAIAGNNITIEYGRPYMKGRKIMGGLVPFGEVWRTGADEATTLNTESDIMLGSLHVPAGMYSLFTLPTDKGWTLIVNKTAKQWGAFKYDKAQDLGRTPMKVSTLSAPVEEFTIAIEPTGARNGVLKMRWEKTEASVDFMIH